MVALPSYMPVPRAPRTTGGALVTAAGTAREDRLNQSMPSHGECRAAPGPVNTERVQASRGGSRSRRQHHQHTQKEGTSLMNVLTCRRNTLLGLAMLVVIAVALAGTAATASAELVWADPVTLDYDANPENGPSLSIRDSSVAVVHGEPAAAYIVRNEDAARYCAE